MTKYIIVLSGGLDKKGNPSSWVINRLNFAINEYEKYQDCKIICLGAGTFYKGHLLSERGYIQFECKASYDYLRDKGVKSTDIYVEWSSYDTIGNIYYLFLNFIIPLKINDNILVVTSSFHMSRVKLIFEYMVRIFMKNLKIHFEDTENSMPFDLLKLRQEKEKYSCEKFNILTKNKSNLSDFCRWINESHNIYSCSWGEIQCKNEKSLESY